MSDKTFHIDPDHVWRVNPWRDPVVEAAGLWADGEYVERFWLPVLGPSSILLLRRLRSDLGSQQQITVSHVELAGELGLAIKPLCNTLRRLERFGVALINWPHATLQVRLALPVVPVRQRERWPDHLHRLHHAWSLAA